MNEQPGKKLTYRDAGLDLALYEQSIAGMVPSSSKTHTPRVLDGFGGFAAPVQPRLQQPAFRHATIAIPSSSPAPTASAPSSRSPA